MLSARLAAVRVLPSPLRGLVTSSDLQRGALGRAPPAACEAGGTVRPPPTSARRRRRAADPARRARRPRQLGRCAVRSAVRGGLRRPARARQPGCGASTAPWVRRELALALGFLDDAVNPAHLLVLPGVHACVDWPMRGISASTGTSNSVCSTGRRAPINRGTRGRTRRRRPAASPSASAMQQNSAALRALRPRRQIRAVQNAEALAAAAALDLLLHHRGGSAAPRAACSSRFSSSYSRCSDASCCSTIGAASTRC